jgi:hypothetical protein
MIPIQSLDFKYWSHMLRRSLREPTANLSAWAVRSSDFPTRELRVSSRAKTESAGNNQTAVSMFIGHKSWTKSIELCCGRAKRPSCTTNHTFAWSNRPVEWNVPEQKIWRFPQQTSGSERDKTTDVRVRVSCGYNLLRISIFSKLIDVYFFV